jgi:hypothetical protein
MSTQLLSRQDLQQHSLPDMAGLVRLQQLQPGLQLRGAAASEALLRDSMSSESALSSYSAPGPGRAAGGAASGRTSNNGGGSPRATRSSMGARSTTDQLELAQVRGQCCRAVCQAAGALPPLHGPSYAGRAPAEQGLAGPAPLLVACCSLTAPGCHPPARPPARSATRPASRQ